MQTAIQKLKRGLSHLDKGRLRDSLAGSSAKTVPTVIGAPLPPVDAPRIDDIVVVVPEREEPGADEILARFGELRREHAVERQRSADETVELGDAVLFDVVGWQDGQAVPFTARRDQWIDITHDETLPGFALGLVGAPVGGTAVVDVTLPVDYPVESLRAKRVVFGVSVKEVYEIQLPPEDSSFFHKRTGLGETIDEVMEGVARLVQEDEVDALIEQGREMVLDELARRLDVELPAGLVNDEIRRAWQKLEGDLLIEAGATFDDQQRCFAAWRDSEETRRDAESRLRRALALGAVAKRDALRVGKEDVNECLRGISKATGTPMVDLVTEVQRDNALQRLLSEKLLSALAEEHVIAAADIRFAGA
jgi:trigger factor